MRGYSRRPFRVKHFLMILIAGVLLGAIMILLFPQFLSKNPPEGLVLRPNYLENTIPLTFEVAFWKPFKPETSASNASASDFPRFLKDTVAATYPDVCIFISVYLETLKNANNKKDEPVLPETYASVFRECGVFAIQESTSRFSTERASPYHLVWSRVKPRLLTGMQSTGESSVFGNTARDYPYDVLELTLGNGNLLLFILDFSAVKELSEIGRLLGVLKEDITGQYVQGKSVIVSGDWNLCLPGTQNCSGTAESLPVLWTPEGWNWYYPLNQESNAFYGLPYRDAFTGMLTSPDLDIVEFMTLTPEATQNGSNGVPFGSAILLRIQKH